MVANANPQEMVSISWQDLSDLAYALLFYNRAWSDSGRGAKGKPEREMLFDGGQLAAQAMRRSLPPRAMNAAMRRWEQEHYGDEYSR